MIKVDPHAYTSRERLASYLVFWIAQCRFQNLGVSEDSLRFTLRAVHWSADESAKFEAEKQLWSRVGSAIVANRYVDDVVDVVFDYVKAEGGGKQAFVLDVESDNEHFVAERIGFSAKAPEPSAKDEPSTRIGLTEEQAKEWRGLIALSKAKQESAGAGSLLHVEFGPADVSFSPEDGVGYHLKVDKLVIVARGNDDFCKAVAGMLAPIVGCLNVKSKLS